MSIAPPHVSRRHRPRRAGLAIVIAACFALTACEVDLANVAGTNTLSTPSATSLATRSAAATPTLATPTSTPSPQSSPTPKPTPTPTVPGAQAIGSLSGFIAFVSDRFDHAEIYLYDVDRNEVIQWTNDRDAKRNPAWAPDGRTLVYSALRDGSWQIYKKSISGGRETKLTSAPGDNYEPVWSPDGKAIAFTSNRDGREQVYVMDAEGKNVRNLSKNNFADFQPSWSPDSKLLAFTSNRNGNWQIFVANADGTNARNISRSYAGDWTAAWSPDGSRIAFTSDRDGNAEVYVMNADGSGAVNLTKSPGADWSPTWSADGQRIAFISKRDGNFEMYMMNADGTSLKRLTNDLGDDVQPAWRWEPARLAAARVPAISASTPSLDEGPKLVTLWHFEDNPKLDGMRSSALQALGQNETAYPVPAGLVFGFEPGDSYQEIYVRDLSWMGIAAMYFYPPQYLRDSVEEFLRRQYTDNQPLEPLSKVYPGEGAISGLFSPTTPYIKHTTTSDEEANLIRAAYTYWAMSGDTGWLRKEINGQTVITRLNRAMEWLFRWRIDPATSLFKRAHTTDWGDVKIEKTGSPTELQPGDALTASIFDQAMIYQALVSLATMNKAVGNTNETGRYLNASQDLKGQVEKYLWQPTKGFYRLHWHLTPLTHTGFDEDSMISISNALAIYTGLSDHVGALDKLEEATKAMGAIKPGLSLYPPYPTGVFAYVQMAEGVYQNGGLWDWWGGTQITAEFEHGLRTRAFRHLYQVADDWFKHPRDIYEWQSPRTGVNRGSDNYGGSVATMTEAIVRGVYGLKLEGQDVSISPRLGEHPGWIRAYVPASGLFVAYRYQISPQALQLSYETNYAQEITFRVVMPPNSAPSRVSIDGATVQFRTDVINEDSYTVFTGPTGAHTIEIALGRR